MHDETRQRDSELGKLLSESYKKRKQEVQHAIQNKISADRLKNVNSKCVTSKNNSKGFRKSRSNPSHFIDPVDKTTLIENKGKIEKCLGTVFSIKRVNKSHSLDYDIL